MRFHLIRISVAFCFGGIFQQPHQ